MDHPSGTPYPVHVDGTAKRENARFFKQTQPRVNLVLHTQYPRNSGYLESLGSCSLKLSQKQRVLGATGQFFSQTIPKTVGFGVTELFCHQTIPKTKGTWWVAFSGLAPRVTREKSEALPVRLRAERDRGGAGRDVRPRHGAREPPGASKGGRRRRFFFFFGGGRRGFFSAFQLAFREVSNFNSPAIVFFPLGRFPGFNSARSSS